MKDTGWEPVQLERVRDGFLLKVFPAADRKRWRWTVLSLEYNTRPRMNFEHAGGYRFTQERAIKAADKACDALVKSREEGES